MHTHTLDDITVQGGTTAAKTAIVGLTQTARTATAQFIAVGDPTAITMDIEGSMDGTTWALLESKVFTAGELVDLSALSFVIDKPVNLVRAKATVLTFTTSCTITTKISFT